MAESVFCIRGSCDDHSEGAFRNEREFSLYLMAQSEAQARERGTWFLKGYCSNLRFDGRGELEYGRHWVFQEDSVEVFPVAKDAPLCDDLEGDEAERLALEHQGHGEVYERDAS